MRPDYFLGLDLGQTRDFTALAVLERQPPTDAGTAVEPPEYALRHLHRFPLGTTYTEIVPAVAALVRSGPLAESPVVVDQTGVGRAVVDLMRQAIGWVVPVTITGGHAATVTEDHSFHVPKKELVTSLQVVMQSRRLRIARQLHEAAVLVRELQQFQVKITQAAHETFGVWREGNMTIWCWPWRWPAGGRSAIRPWARAPSAAGARAYWPIRRRGCS